MSDDRAAERPQEPLFHRDGAWLVPTAMTQGPWNPEHQHGGAVGAALAWLLEQQPTPVPMRPTRFVVDLMHPVPIRPLRSDVRVVRAGRRVQLVEALLLEGERPLARASALLLRVDPDLGLAADARSPRAEPLAAPPEPLQELETASRRASAFGYLPGFIRALDFRPLRMKPRTGEPGQAWIRLRAPVVAGEAASPLVRLAAAGDFTSAFGLDVDFTRFVAINPDVTLHIHRLPESDWIGIETVSRIAADGIGTSSGTLHDLRGAVAHSHTAVYVGAR